MVNERTVEARLPESHVYALRRPEAVGRQRCDDMVLPLTCSAAAVWLEHFPPQESLHA